MRLINVLLLEPSRERYNTSYFINSYRITKRENAQSWDDKKFVAGSRILQLKYVFRVSIATYLADAKFYEGERSLRICFWNATIPDKIGHRVENRANCSFKFANYCFASCVCSAYVTYICMYVYAMYGVVASRTDAASNRRNWIAAGSQFTISPTRQARFCSSTAWNLAGREKGRWIDDRHTLIEPFIPKIEFDECKYANFRNALSRNNL